MSSAVYPQALRLELPLDAIADLCRRWRIHKLEVFGSALTEEFGANSDVDFLYTWECDAQWAWEVVRLRDELAALVGRPVDLVSRWAVERSRNHLRKQAILSNVATVFESKCVAVA
jgi:predicted nucleotidyltransferase